MSYPGNKAPTKRYRGNLLISILILDPQPGIQALLSHSFVIEPSARGVTPVSAPVQTLPGRSIHNQANQTSRAPRLLIFPSPTDSGQRFPYSFLHYFSFNFLQKGSNTKSYLKWGVSLIFHSPFLGFTTSTHTLPLKHRGTCAAEISSQVSAVSWVSDSIPEGSTIEFKILKQNFKVYFCT